MEVDLGWVGVPWESEHARLRIPSIMNSRVKIFSECDKRCIFLIRNGRSAKERLRIPNRPFL